MAQVEYLNACEAGQHLARDLSQPSIRETEAVGSWLYGRPACSSSSCRRHFRKLEVKVHGLLTLRHVLAPAWHMRALLIKGRGLLRVSAQGA